MVLQLAIDSTPSNSEVFPSLLGSSTIMSPFTTVSATNVLLDLTRLERFKQGGFTQSGLRCRERQVSHCPAEASQLKDHEGATFPNHRKSSPLRLEAGVLAAAVAAKEKMKELTSWLQLGSRWPVSPRAIGTHHAEEARPATLLSHSRLPGSQHSLIVSPKALRSSCPHLGS